MKLQTKSISSKPRHSRLRANLPSLFLSALGSIILTMVAYIIWNDMTRWSKDISLILFGSRTGEQISLGIGMKVIYYFLIGMSLLLLGLITLRKKTYAAKTDSDLRPAYTPAVLDAQRQKQNDGSPTPAQKKTSDVIERSDRLLDTRQEQRDSSTCSPGFGYLSKRAKGTPVPKECLTCRKLPECMNQA